MCSNPFNRIEREMRVAVLAEERVVLNLFNGIESSTLITLFARAEDVRIRSMELKVRLALH